MWRTSYAGLILNFCLDSLTKNKLIGLVHEATHVIKSFKIKKLFSSTKSRHSNEKQLKILDKECKSAYYKN